MRNSYFRRRSPKEGANEAFLERWTPPLPTEKETPPPDKRRLTVITPSPWLTPRLSRCVTCRSGVCVVCARAWCASHLSLAHSLSLSATRSLSLSPRATSLETCAARRCRYARASSWRRCCWWLERRERSVWRALPSLVLPSLAHLASSRSRRRRSARRMSKKWTTRSTQSRISSPLTPS